MKTLSIIIPAYNEEAFIGSLLKRIDQVKLPDFKKEVIVVDDCSKDRTAEIAASFDWVRVIRKEKNGGKGSATKLGISQSTGDWVLIQDADLEYDPNDYATLLEATSTNDEKLAVYGSRILGQARLHGRVFPFFGKHKQQKLAPWAAGQVLSAWTFLLYRIWITDVLTAYKLYPGKLVRSFKLTSTGFETDHEITAKLRAKGVKIKEVPIEYVPRSVEEGKKIKGKDFFIAMWTFLKYRT